MLLMKCSILNDVERQIINNKNLNKKKLKK